MFNFGISNWVVSYTYSVCTSFMVCYSFPVISIPWNDSSCYEITQILNNKQIEILHWFKYYDTKIFQKFINRLSGGFILYRL